MTTENKVIKVKDTSIIGKAIIVTCLFPLIFMTFSVLLNLSYLLTALITLTVLGIAFTFFVRHIKKNEDVYELIADNTSISIKKSKTFGWHDIEKIETFSRRPIGHRMAKKYIKLVLKDGEIIVLDASNYDIWYEDLKEELLSLRRMNN
ncbi:MAG: hypothetical protein V4538_14090 [Bacteroidota bacterium]